MNAEQTNTLKILNDAMAALFNESALLPIESTLLTVFRYASLGGLEKEIEANSPERVAKLFDQLIGLVNAVRELQLSGKETPGGQEGVQHV